MTDLKLTELFSVVKHWMCYAFTKLQESFNEECFKIFNHGFFCGAKDLASLKSFCPPKLDLLYLLSSYTEESIEVLPLYGV